MSELVYRKPCEHGKLRVHWIEGETRLPRGRCPGGGEQVLAPDKVLLGLLLVTDGDHWDHLQDATVADVLAVLDGEDT